MRQFSSLIENGVVQITTGHIFQWFHCIQQVLAGEFTKTEFSTKLMYDKILLYCLNFLLESIIFLTFNAICTSCSVSVGSNVFYAWYFTKYMQK